MSLSKIVVFDMSGLGSTPRVLTVDTAVASALVRAGVAAAHDSAQAGALSLGGALSGVTPTQIVLVHGPQQDRVTRITVPLAAAQAAAAVGAAAGVVGPLAAGVAVAQPNPSISLSSAVTLAEGNSGTTLFSFTLTLVRDGSTAVFPFTWAVAGTGANPANAADFGGALPSGSGSFAVGETTKTITVSVAGDTTVEPDENFLLSATVTGIGTATSLGTITNDDAVVTPPTVSLSSALVQAEGNSGTTLFSYTLTLARNGSTAAFPYSYSVAGTGANPADAADFGGTFPSGSGTFAAGETTKTIAILATGDTAVEPDEAFLLSATVTGVGTVTANGTISNDDVVVTAAAARRAKLQLGATGVTNAVVSRTYTNLFTTNWNRYSSGGGYIAPRFESDYWDAATGGHKKLAAGEVLQLAAQHPWPYNGGADKWMRVWCSRPEAQFSRVNGQYASPGARTLWQGGVYIDYKFVWPTGADVLAWNAEGTWTVWQIDSLPDATADGLGYSEFYCAEIDGPGGNWIVDPRTTSIHPAQIARLSNFGVWRVMDLQLTNQLYSMAAPLTARARFKAQGGTWTGALCADAKAVLTLSGGQSVTFNTLNFSAGYGLWSSDYNVNKVVNFAEPLFNPAKTPGAPFYPFGARAAEMGIRCDAPSGSTTTIIWEGSTKTIVMKPKAGCTWSQLVTAWDAQRSSFDVAVNNAVSCMMRNIVPTAGLSSTTVAAFSRTAFTGGVTPEIQGQISAEQIVDVAIRANLTAVWFQIPANADETWIRTNVAVLRDGLPSTCALWIEFANEVWNVDFPVNAEVKAYGLANNPYGWKIDGTGAQADLYGSQSLLWGWCKLATDKVTIAKDEWKKTGRTDCRGIFAGQAGPGSSGIWDTMAGYINGLGAQWLATFDDMAVAPYWTTAVGAVNRYVPLPTWQANYSYSALGAQVDPFADNQTKIVRYNGLLYIVVDAHTSTAGNPPGSAGGAAHYIPWTPENYEPYGKAAIEAQASIVSGLKTWASAHSKRLLSYEQGPGDFYPGSGSADRAVMQPYVTALSHSDVIFRLQQYALFKHFEMEGSDSVYAQFGDTLPWTSDNPWQWQDYDGAPDAISPKRRAIQAFVANGATNPYVNGIPAPATVLPAYLGQVATRSYIPNNFGSTQAQARTLHTAMDSITSLQVSYANWQVDTGTGQATNPGAAATIKVAIEYPLGTVAGTFLWSGAVSGSIPSGSTLLSDALAITIPSGAQFALRPYITCSGNVSYMRTGSGAQFLSGEALNMGTSITDQTAGGTITNNSTGSNIYPVAIVAQTTKPTFLLVGDSITAGSNDTTSGQGDTGSLARSIGASYAYINEGVSSDRAMWMSHSYQQRRDLQKYVSHVLVAYGVNDLATGLRTAAQVYADLKAIWSMFPTRTVLQTTITPSSVTTTDSYATVANQTPHSSNTARVALNGMIRSGPPGGGFIELADQVESARDSGVFKAPGYTVDGTHPSPAGYQAILNSGAIAPLTIGATALATNLWSPFELGVDNYNLWLDASDPSTASDGSKWLPRNNFANYSQTTASKQPVLTPNAINGRAAFLFDGTDDFLSGSGSMLTLTNGKATATLAGVFLSQNTTGSNVVYANIVNTSGSNSTRFDLYVNGASGTVALGARTVDTASVVNAVSAATVNGAAAMALGEIDVPNGALNLRVNGAADGANTVPAGTGFPATSSNAVGVGANNASAFYKGYVGEVIQLPRLLTAVEKQKLEGYWRNKWGIPLAAGHPYASSVPLV